MRQPHQPGHQAPQLALGCGCEQAGQQLLDAQAALLQLLDLEHEIDRHAMLFEMLAHAGRGLLAGAEQGAQVVGLLQQGRVVVRFGVLAQLFGHARELAKRLVGQQFGAHAPPQRP